MQSLIKKGKTIIATDGFKVFSTRLIKYSIVKLKRLFQKTDTVNIEKWKSLKDKYKGQRVFIIGAGPSINKTPLHLLKGEYTMCFNRVNLLYERLNWKPNFYMVTDDLKLKEIYKDINEEILPAVDYAFFPDLHPSNVNFKKYLDETPKIHWLNMDEPEYSLDLPKCGINKTVVNGGLQILAYLGFEEIYMLGVDMTFAKRNVSKINERDWVGKKDDDPNHFDPRYDGKGMAYRNPTLDDMLDYFIAGRKFFDKHNKKIYNASYGGVMEEYPRVNLTDVLNLSDEQQFKLFVDLVIPGSRAKNFGEAFSGYPILNNAEDFDKSIGDFVCGDDIAPSVITRAVFTHIPFGPCEDKYVFKKR
ncbi:6-hydroxymethylpterin diphosphokinase MptE-like protein [Mucilaginibacter sp. Mucisp84]|uniref:6-hydroxymethylpterin diphosphokinase MptE-like protein n=1 Tax=Mucilaginibacter sp. Mucisp84 TaxID=3243058 RepID=UPI0039A4B27C